MMIKKVMNTLPRRLVHPFPFCPTSIIKRTVHNEVKDIETRKKLTNLEIQHMKRKDKKIAVITAYDYPTGKHAETAGFDVILVGDSLGMVVLGYETTQPVSMEDMLHHCKAARRGAPSSFIVADMPFGSYESSPEQALHNAFRLIKEAGMDAVKIEGGKARVKTIEKLVESGISVMGHVGLTPQGVGVLGGFRAQGRTAVKAKAIVEDALALQQAGAFSIVIECVPAIVAKAITEALAIPTIGIGAGQHTDGQVLVYHDLLGFIHHPQHNKAAPSFSKQYASLGGVIHNALLQYKNEVKEKLFPTDDYNKFKMSFEEEKKFLELILQDQDMVNTETKNIAKKLLESDEFASTKVY